LPLLASERKRRGRQHESAVGNLARGSEGARDTAPFAFASELLLRAIASGPEIENLAVARIKTEGAGSLSALVGDEADVILERDIAVDVALQLLESDRVRPQERDAALVRSERPLRLIARFSRPIRMMGRGIVPIHQERTVARVEIVTDEATRIGLLVDERKRRNRAEQALVDLMADLEIGLDHAGGHQRPDQLGVARTHELDLPLCNELAEARDPIGIERLDGLQRIAGELDPDRSMDCGKCEQRPIAAFQDRAALAFLDRGESEVEMEDREQMESRGIGRRDWRAG